MHARTLRVVAVVLVAACSGDVTQPARSLGTAPSSDISDGATGGNTDFWFLSPMVPDPSGNPLYLDNGFDPSLTPMVTITSPPGGAVVLGPTAAPLIVNKSQYQLDWKVPPVPQSYRISVTVGATALGFADVTASSKGKVAGAGFIPVSFGTTLPIKFVIEGCALVAGECSAETVNTAQGGTVETDEGGVTIPPQPTGQKVLVTVTNCPDIPTDLPTKSDCIRVTTTPPLSASLTIPATVWVCGVPAAPLGSQEERYTMYRYDALPSPTTTALPHAHDECDPPAVSDAGGSLRGVLADLVRGRLKSAGRQLASMLGPRPLYATVMLDVGAGGETDGFSDFQLVLPGSMTKCAGDGATGSAGFAIAAKVCVADVGGDPVAGATVHFTAGTGSVSAASVVTNAAGEAAVSWTLASGANSLTASGNGLGGDDPNNGPRAGVDPFQPLHAHFGDGAGVDGPEVPVTTGSVTFSATGVDETITVGLPDFGSTGWSIKEITSTSGGSANWYQPTFDAHGQGFLFNKTAAFGSPSANTCGLTMATPWNTDTDLLARKKFSISSGGAGDVEIRVAIDNDVVELYLNGTQLVATDQTREGCAVPGTAQDVVFTGAVTEGTNLIAIRARDRGSVSYLDLKVSYVVVIP